MVIYQLISNLWRDTKCLGGMQFIIFDNLHHWYLSWWNHGWLARLRVIRLWCPVLLFSFCRVFLGHCRLGRVRNLSSSMVVPALMSMIVASIEKLFYFHCRPSPPEMHQKHFYIPASLSSVFNLYNSTHIDRHTIKLSIIRGLARKNMVPKKTWKMRKLHGLVCFVLHSCFVPFSFFARLDVLFLIVFAFMVRN